MNFTLTVGFILICATAASTSVCEARNLLTIYSKLTKNQVRLVFLCILKRLMRAKVLFDVGGKGHANEKVQTAGVELF